MFVLGLGSGRSSSTVSLRAKKYFLRSSVIYSESCRVCDRPPLPLLLAPSLLSLTYPAGDVSAPHMHPLLLLLLDECRGEAIMSERRKKKRGGERAWLTI